MPPPDRRATLYDRIGQNVAAARFAAGLTQQELADLLAIRRSVIAMIETGRQTLRVDQALDIAAATETPLCTLLGLPASRPAADADAGADYREPTHPWPC